MNYCYPPNIPKSQHYLVVVNGMQQTVISADSADICIFSGEGPFEVEISLFVRRDASQLNISPVNRVHYRADGWKLHCHIPEPLPGLMVSGSVLPPLFLFPCPAVEKPPLEDDPSVIYFRSGTFHDVGEITLSSGRTLYIEGGAIVRGCVRAKDAQNIRIYGHGILDGRYAPWVREEIYRMAMVFDNCQGINIEGITSIHPRLMTTVLGGSQTAQVSWLHALSEMLSTDGVDIIGSSDVLIQNCFFATNDDCVALKAANWSYTPADGIGYWRHNVERVQVRGCTILNRGSGNALEIGHETSCDHINNVVFEDCDILAKHGYGAVFGLHNCGKAIIQNITYRNIRIEHHYDRLFDLRIEPSVFSDGHPEELGSVDNILFEDIDISQKALNVGYTVSVVGGHSPSSIIKNVKFRRIRINGQEIKNLDALRLHLRYSKNVILLDATEQEEPPSLLMSEIPSPELEKWILRGWNTLLIALASTGQHGPALPLNRDILLGRETCLRAARILGKTFVGPDIPFGYAPQDAAFPGTIQLRKETLKTLIEDVVDSAVRANFRLIYFWIAHAENFTVLQECLPNLRTRYLGCRIDGLRSLADYTTVTRDKLAEEENFSAVQGGPDAGEIETSMMLALEPSLVHMRLAEELNSEPLTSPVEKIMTEGVVAGFANGVLGDQRSADAGCGNRSLDRSARFLAAEVAALRKEMSNG